MNTFEFKNLVKNLKNSLKEKSFFKDLRKEVDTGANGTQNYVLKKGMNKNSIATTKQELNLLAAIVHIKLYRMRCMFKLVYFLKFQRNISINLIVSKYTALC